MARSTPGVTRQRLVDEAVHLFATKGYAATTVADIQAACGLATGSGALYKHFPSKRAVLEQAVRRNAEKIALASADAVAPRAERGTDALDRLAGAVWDVLENDRELVRIMLREFDTFPELFERMWQDVVADVYRAGAAWLRAERDAGRVDVDDPEATAAVLLASITYFPILRTMIGHTPGEITAERFRTAWVEHAARTLRMRAG